MTLMTNEPLQSTRRMAPPKAVDTLLEEARACRDRVHRVRRLMYGIEDEGVRVGLSAYIEDLERRAVEMEEYAGKLDKSRFEARGNGQRFIETAKEFGCDQDEEALKKKLGDLAEAKPADDPKK